MQAKQISTLAKQMQSERTAREAADLTNAQLRQDLEKARAAAARPDVANSPAAEDSDINSTSCLEKAEAGEQEGLEQSVRLLHLSLSVEEAEAHLRKARAAERVLELQRNNDAAEAEASSLFSSEVWKTKQKFVMSPASRQLLDERRCKLPAFEERQHEFQVRNAEWRAEQKRQAEVRPMFDTLFIYAFSQTMKFVQAVRVSD